jgi:futalosine hydrolase
MRLLIVTSVDAEAKAIGELTDGLVIVAGIGRTNAAAATTAAIIEHGRFDAAVSAGVAGALPESGLTIGDAVVASSCVYAEEGLITPTGFADMASMGFALGDFAGNTVPVDERLLEALAESFPIGPIATVATCSGTDAAAAEVLRRTGAVAEAMEGAAVVHAARRLRVPAIELRAISNTTGDRPGQRWDLPRALAALSTAIPRAVAALQA